MSSPTRQFEGHMEEVTRSKAAADRRNKAGRIAHDLQQAKVEDSLAERLDDALFEDMDQTSTQELLHDFGGGVSKGPPKGGWPQFDPVTGDRLDRQTALSASPPH